MASYDQLSSQQRAIVDLILKRGQSYDQLADTLGMPEARVRELAREALTSLAPVSAAAVDEGWRAQIADYLLGQQAAPEAASTRGQLRRSEAARGWSRSVLDSLEHLYPKGELPTIPAGDPPLRGAGDSPEPKPAKPARERKPAAPRAPLTPEAAAIVRRRRIAGIAAGAVALLFVLLIWPVGLLLGGDDSSDAAGGPCGADAKAASVGQVVLEPVDRGANAAGVAQVTNTGGQCEVRIIAKLPRATNGQAYEVWLANSAADARSLGAQVTDRKGNFAGAAPFPANYRDYRYLEITREKVDRNRANSGNVVLRAETADIKQQTRQQQQQR